MSDSKIKNLPKNTVELEITIPWKEIQTVYSEVLDSIVKDTQISGFRKGKAPKKLVEEKADKNKLYETVIKKIIPDAYAGAVTRHKLTPVISPKLEILKAKPQSDWVVKATLSLKPQVNLKNYKQKIRELKKSKVTIWTPGKSIKDEKKDKNLKLDEIIETLLSESEVEISDQLLNNEVNRMLSDLVDQTKQLGLTVEQYLLSKGKTNETLRMEYKETAEKNLSLEFVLIEIADKENITVDAKDIDDLLSKIEKEEERSRLKKDSYYLAHLIRQQKTIDFIKNL